MTSVSPRPEIAGMSPYEPGKPIQEISREYDLDESPVKLASNENPYSPPEDLRETYTEEFSRLNRYPDGGSYYLRDALSRKYDWPRDGVVIGAGSDEIVDFLGKVFLREGDEVLVAEPSFIRHQMIATMMGAKPVSVPLTDDFGLDLGRMADAVSSSTRFVCLPNPNNPTSRYVSETELDRFLEALPGHVTVLLDEAYCEFMDQDDYPDGRRVLSCHESSQPSLVLLRTFSKAYGLAGLRVGYALMAPERASELHKVRPPFNVSRPAQAVAEEALEYDDFLETCRERIIASRRRICQSLQDRELEVVPPSANFMLLKTPGEYGAESFTASLLKQGVIVRSMAPYGLPEYVRVSVGTPDENDRFFDALDCVLG